MPSCAVKWCRSHSDMRNAALTFHQFPKNAILREKWRSAVRLERNEHDWMPSKSSCICSIHFQNEDIYMLNNGKRKLLRNSAVPVCTMINKSNVDVKSSVDFSGPSCISINDTLQDETSMVIKEEEINSFDDTNSQDESSIVTKKEEINSFDDTNSQDESSIVIKEEKLYPYNLIINETYSQNETSIQIKEEETDFKENTRKRTHICGCSYKSEKIPRIDVSNQVNPLASPLRAEETKKPHILIGCPRCNCMFYVPNEVLGIKAGLPVSEESKPPCSTLKPSSRIESATILELAKQLALKTKLLRKRLFKIKNLQRQVKRLKTKKEFKDIIKNREKNKG